MAAAFPDAMSLLPPAWSRRSTSRMKASREKSGDCARGARAGGDDVRQLSVEVFSGVHMRDCFDGGGATLL